MARGVPVVIGGNGIAAGTPFTLTKVLSVGNTLPPTAISGRLAQLTDAKLSVTAAGPSGGANSFVVGEGSDDGGAARAVIIGYQILGSTSAASVDQILIGSNMNGGALNPNGSNLIVIGANITLDAGGLNVVGGGVLIGANIVQSGGVSHNSNVLIGQGATSGGGNAVGVGASVNVGTQCVSIGRLSQAINGGAAVAIGDNTKAGNNGVSVGGGITSTATNGVQIGFQAQLTGSGSIGIGRDCADGGFADCIVIGQGAVAAEVNNCLIGSTTHFINRCIIGAGYTPTGYGGLTLEFSSASAGTNVAAANTVIKGGRGTGNSVGGEIQFHTGSILGSGSTYQSAVRQLTILPSAGGAAAPNLRFDNVTSGAGASAGTLANAPSVGNPSFWLPVSIAGAVRYIPCWT